MAVPRGELMSLTKESVVSKIREAFHGVTLGKGVGLFEGQGLDDYEDPGTCRAYRDKDEKYEWQNIPVENLNRCYSSLSFFDAEGMRFHLPAFLIAQLDGQLRVDPVFHLAHLDEWAKSKFALLSIAQREAVRDFLTLSQDDPDFQFDRPHIEAALANYWTSQIQN
jgi:hypothetical protein